jgi:hypothetical protein
VAGNGGLLKEQEMTLRAGRGSRDSRVHWLSQLVVLREECQTSENKTQTQVAGGKEDLLC